jgi:hypothetical protein
VMDVLMRDRLWLTGRQKLPSDDYFIHFPIQQPSQTCMKQSFVVLLTLRPKFTRPMSQQ